VPPAHPPPPGPPGLGGSMSLEMFLVAEEARLIWPRGRSPWVVRPEKAKTNFARGWEEPPSHPKLCVVPGWVGVETPCLLWWSRGPAADSLLVGPDPRAPHKTALVGQCGIGVGKG